MRRIDLPSTLQPVLAAHGLKLDSFVRRSSALVLFGSRTQRGASCRDWDLLAIGDGKSIHTDALDLLWISEARTQEQGWLESELATHISGYGQLIWGDAPWCAATQITQHTVAAKTASLRGRLRAISELRGLLGPKSLAHYRVVLRRDVQRLTWLRSGSAVPPRPVLDDTWAMEPDLASWVARAGLDSGLAQAMGRLFD